MALTKFGEKTTSIFLNDAESHKLHLAFTVADGETIRRGQPVILSGDSDTIEPSAGDGSDVDSIIGYSIQDAKEKEECTIAMRGYAVVWALASGTVSPGPVEYAGMSATSGKEHYTTYKVTTAAENTNGWAIDEGTTGSLIRIILR